MKARPYADQAELQRTRGTKRQTRELLQSIMTIADQPTPMKKPRQQCRLPRSYRPRVGTTTNINTSNLDSTSPITTKQTFNHNSSPSSTSPKSPFSSCTSQTPPKPPSHKNHKRLTLRTCRIHPLPFSFSSLTTEHTHLSSTSHSLLLLKAARLSKYEPLIPSRAFRRHKATTINATLAFAQSEAGTAFCIREDGLLLTAAHCISEGDEREAVGRVVWLVMPVSEDEAEEEEEDGEKDDSGVKKRGGRVSVKSKSKSRIVGAKCIAWDMTRDLALLKVTHAQPPPDSNKSPSSRGTGIYTFPCVKLPPRTPKSVPGSQPPLGKPCSEPALHTPLVAIGHPSDEHPDDPPGIKAYGSEHRRILQLSSGRYLGIAPDKVDNPHDTAETGAMRHDCWTYWGYSGGPIFERDSGVLAGVHVDWNPQEPLIKRAVPWVAVEGFLEGCGFWG